VVPPPPEPAVLPLDVQVIASPRPNLDEQGESLPAAVRLSLLKSASRLQPVGGCDGLAPACPK
jgi:predicted component of type VI protein secretion system